MYAKLIAAAAIGALLSTSAFAQTSSSTQNASAKGEWQSSKLIHMNVYNAQNEKIGDIKELMLDKSGKVENVVIGVGGFLGMGEHDVAVNFDRLKWSDSAATTGSGQSASESKKTDRNYPDHAVLNATKDQLKAMPNFQYSK
jgi:sporulation protein YlmC with PRC-barrel domain